MAKPNTTELIEAIASDIGESVYIDIAKWHPLFERCSLAHRCGGTAICLTILQQCEGRQSFTNSAIYSGQNWRRQAGNPFGRFVAESEFG